MLPFTIRTADAYPLALLKKQSESYDGSVLLARRLDDLAKMTYLGMVWSGSMPRQSIKTEVIPLFEDARNVIEERGVQENSVQERVRNNLSWRIRNLYELARTGKITYSLRQSA